MALLGLLSVPGAAAEPDEAADRPESPDALPVAGTGLIRDYPVPVPDHLPRRNIWAQTVQGGGGLIPWIIFVNFDGATLTSGGDSAQNNITQISEMAGEFAPGFVGDFMMRDAIIQAVNTDFEAYNIDIVTERPDSGEYAMTLVGPTNPFGSNVLGIAPVDCGNLQTHSNISYAFHSEADGFGPVTVASTISHEQGHAFGLEHINEPASILNPSEAGGDPVFMDTCIALTAGGGSNCANIHDQYCAAGSGQNSHRELLQLFGPAVPDTDPPLIVITAPVNGTTFNSGDGFTVIADIIDESPVLEAELYVNGELFQLDNLEPWGWPVNGLPDGLHVLEVVAADENGNQGLSTPVSVLIGGDEGGSGGGTGVESDGEDDTDGGGPGGGTASGGDEDTESAGANDDDGGGDGCGCVSDPTPRSWWPRVWWMAAPLLLLVGRRRRRA